MDSEEKKRTGEQAASGAAARSPARPVAILVLLSAGVAAVFSGILSGDIAEIESEMTYGNFDVPSESSFVNRLLPGVIDAAKGRFYEFHRSIHWKTLIILGSVFIVFWLLRAFGIHAWDLKRAAVQWIVFVITRLGVLRASGVFALPRCSFGTWPFLTCQACEMAAGACPAGSLQMSLSRLRIPQFTIGILIAGGVLFGRTLCGWACPLGLFLDIAGRFMGRREPMIKAYAAAKFAFLGLTVAVSLVIGILDLGIVLPFCSTLCLGGVIYGLIPYYATTAVSGFGILLPAGMVLLGFHLAVLISFFMLSRRYTARFFCRVVCPVGAFLGLFNRISLVRVVHNHGACSSCGACRKHCPMDINLGDDSFLEVSNCIRCGACVNVCPSRARTWTPSIVNRSIHLNTSPSSASQASKMYPSVNNSESVDSASMRQN